MNTTVLRVTFTHTLPPLDLAEGTQPDPAAELIASHHQAHTVSATPNPMAVVLAVPQAQCSENAVDLDGGHALLVRMVDGLPSDTITAHFARVTVDVTA